VVRSRSLAGAHVIGRAERHANPGQRLYPTGRSPKLPGAVHLYETFGFRHVPRETLSLASTRIDAFMELLIS
jgi:hypothetical protein